ncbi:MAG: biotin/lipoyl-binding protein [Bacteroidetes bacterium]|nr:biotin/lipoyl-binding protein [Bacteroidota bacterium]
MQKAEVNEKKTLSLLKGEGNEWIIDNEKVVLDKVVVAKNKWHVLKNNRVYSVELVSIDKGSRNAIIKVNATIYTVSIKDKFDELLHDLGMDAAIKPKLNDIKAPMPGLVVQVLVKEGDELLKGDTLLVLEAMKMENAIKAPADMKVKSIKISKGQKVEKGEVLILVN